MSTNTVSFPYSQFTINSQNTNNNQEKQQFFQPSINSKYQFYAIVEPGNNSNIIKKVLSKRSWWSETQPNSAYNFRWKPTSSGIKFDDLQSHYNKKQMVNHIEFHSQISCKGKLYNNIKNYCKVKKINMDNFIPKTFILQVDSEMFEKELSNFLDYFLTINNGTSLKNVWITKPNDLNRGRGIYLFNDLQYFYKLLKDYGKEECLLRLLNQTQRGKQIDFDFENNDYQQIDQISINKDNYSNIFDNSSKQRKSYIFKKKVQKNIVLQKYLESPLLISGRKFDIRLWVLIDQDMNYYYFKEGYLRMASEQYNLSTKKLNNQYIHLTNNAIQKHSQNYSQYEPANIKSFKEFKMFLKQNNCKFGFNDIVNQMKQQIDISMCAASSKLKKCIDRKYNFELFGYDFMIDMQGQVYLIEVNTNPCLEESSTFLSTLITRMLNDMFRITIDKIFSPQQNISEITGLRNKNKKNSAYLNSSNLCLNDFQLDGYSYYENLWEYIGDLNYPKI